MSIILEQKEQKEELFEYFQLCNSVAIYEAQEDIYNWGNATKKQLAFITYLGCADNEVGYYLQKLKKFYGFDKLEVRVLPKRLKSFEREIKIWGLKRYTDDGGWGLDALVELERFKHEYMGDTQLVLEESDEPEPEEAYYYSTGHLPRW